MCNLRRLRTQAVELCYAVAGRDLGDTPIYIALGSEIGLGSEDWRGGFTSPILDLLLRDYIGNAWQGRGPCLVVNDSLLKSWARHDNYKGWFFAVTLHELAHVLQRPTLFDDCPGLTADDLQKEQQAVIDDGKQPPPKGIFVRVQHDRSFVRIALHLEHRSALAGREFKRAQSECLAACGHQHEKFSIDCYREALGDEPSRLVTASFREILNTPLPTIYQELHDVDSFLYERRFLQRKMQV